MHCIVPQPSNAHHFYVADLCRNVVEHYQMRQQDGGDEDSVHLMSWTADTRLESSHGRRAVPESRDGQLGLCADGLDAAKTGARCLRARTCRVSDAKGEYLYEASRFTNAIALFAINQKSCF